MLVDIEKMGLDVRFDIAYATPRNFTGRPVYARPGCYLHEDAAAALARAVDLARRIGIPKTVIDRLFDLTHRTRLDQIEAAFAALGKRLAVQVEDAA